MAETQVGEYKIVSGDESTVLTAMNADKVTKCDVLGFQYNSATDVAVIYEN